MAKSRGVHVAVVDVARPAGAQLLFVPFAPVSPEQEFGLRNAAHGPVDQLVDFLLFPVAGSLM